jgi:protocatechuate 3,4-dioxygenase beta subunit
MVSSSRRALACILFLVAAAFFAHAQQDQTGSISGKVTLKNKGVASILVIAIDTNYSDGEERSRNRAITDNDGNYLINNVPTGDYLVFPIAPALVVENGQRLTITAGETIRDINFALVHSGAITGRITDADGQPLINETVSVVRVEPESDYERHKFASFRTDDRGIYQAFGLRPGKYKVSVGQPLPRQIPLPSHPGFVRKILRQTFYPSVADPEKATILEVTESSEIKDIDIVASAASTFKLTGRIIDGETSKPLPNVRLIVLQSNFPASTGSFSSDSNGEFKLEGATPGRYKFLIFSHNDWRADPLTVDVIDKYLTGLEIKAMRGASLAGVVVVENSDDKVVAPKLSDLLIFASVPNLSTPDYLPIDPIQVNPDGSFKIAGLTAGMNRLHLWERNNSSLRALEIASVEQNGVRQSGDINLKDGEQVAGLRIVAKVVELTGAIRGQIKFENGEPSRAARIIVSISRLNENSSKSLPEGMSSPPEVDSRGRFLIERLAAGTYELSVMMAPPGAQALDDVARQQVTVTENRVSEVTVTVKLKP